MKSGAEGLAVALAYLRALGGDDPAEVTRLVSGDFRNEHHAELGSGCAGRDEYARRLPGFFATFAARSYEVIETVACQPSDGITDVGTTDVVVNYRFRADVDGTPIEIPGMMWISVRNGEIIRRVDCWDSLSFHRQTGTVPSR